MWEGQAPSGWSGICQEGSVSCAICACSVCLGFVVNWGRVKGKAGLTCPGRLRLRNGISKRQVFGKSCSYYGDLLGGKPFF